jgi:NAD(P)-dependent dehydrogenase (short-subunit alcohol dehydrogenase family)
MGSVRGLDGRVALITGARGGLGSAAVKVFTGAGATICRQDKSDPASSASWFDVTDPGQVQDAVGYVIKSYGRIDILLNIVGTWKVQPRVSEMDDDTVQSLMKVNFASAFIMSRAVLPHMLDAKWGRIVNVGAKQGLKSTAGNSAYGAAKAAVIALTQSIAEEGAAYGVSCNAVIPSTMDTPANREGMPKADFSKWVKPEHVAETMAFLCTEAGGNINGAAIPVWNRA